MRTWKFHEHNEATKPTPTIGQCKATPRVVTRICSRTYRNLEPQYLNDFAGLDIGENGCFGMDKPGIGRNERLGPSTVMASVRATCLQLTHTSDLQSVIRDLSFVQPGLPQVTCSSPSSITSQPHRPEQQSRLPPSSSSIRVRR